MQLNDERFRSPNLLLLTLKLKFYCRNSVKIESANKVAKKDEFIGKQTFGVNIICFKRDAILERQY